MFIHNIHSLQNDIVPLLGFVRVSPTLHKLVEKARSRFAAHRPLEQIENKIFGFAFDQTVNPPFVL